jgi:hypothetical protein
MNPIKVFPFRRKMKEPTIVDIRLSDLLGIDITNSSSLTINIIDDLPTNINFSENVGLSTIKNFFLSSLNKLFINPKSLTDGSKVDFNNFDAHVKSVEKHLELEALKSAAPCSCAKKKRSKKATRITFLKEKKDACCS